MAISYQYRMIVHVYIYLQLKTIHKNLKIAISIIYQFEIVRIHMILVSSYSLFFICVQLFYLLIRSALPPKRCVRIRPNKWESRRLRLYHRQLRMTLSSFFFHIRSMLPETCWMSSQQVGIQESATLPLPT